MKKITLFAAVAAAILTNAVRAADDDNRWWTPVQINVASPYVALLPLDRDVYGLRLNVPYGRSIDVYGIDVGGVGASSDFAGIAANVFNWSNGETAGIQVGVVGNYALRNVYGIQIAGIVSNDSQSDMTGIQISPLNFNSAFGGVQVSGIAGWNYSTFEGLQIAPINVGITDVFGGSLGVLNFCSGEFGGGQVGALNMIGGKASGFQIGLINAAQSLSGIQVGFINLNVEGALPIMLVANANF